MSSLLTSVTGVDFLRIRSVDRLAPATRGPDSLVVAVATDAGSTVSNVCTDATVALGVAIGGTTATTFGGSVVIITGLGCRQQNEEN